MPAVTEKEKMLSGELYDASDPELVAMRSRARRLSQAFNRAGPDDCVERARILSALLGALGDSAWIEPPFFCDYGNHILLGESIYINFNCVILDCKYVCIGDQTQIGPNVTIAAATHPLDAHERITGLELAYAVTIGARVWIGAGAIIGARGDDR